MKWIKSAQGHWEEATIPDDIAQAAAKEAKAVADLERQTLLQKAKQLEMERMADALFSTEIDLRGDGKLYRPVRNTANSLALAELLSAYEGAGEKIGNIQEWLKQAVRRRPQLAQEVSWERIPTKVTVEQAETVLRAYCHDHQVGFSQSIFQALRRKHGTNFTYDDIDRAVADGLIFFGEQSDSELQQEADDLAETIVGSQNWYLDSDRKHFDQRGRDAAFARTRQYPIEQLRQQAATLEHNRKLVGLSVSELWRQVQQEREQHLQPTTVELPGGRTKPLLPQVNRDTGETLDEAYFQTLWNTNMPLFKKWCSFYGTEQVIGRMRGATEELQRVLG